MRSKDVLNSFEDIKILMSFLYMNTDNYILYNNGVVDIKIKMNEKLEIIGTNHLDVSLKYTLSISQWLSIIEYLKEQKPTYKFPNLFEEIKDITLSHLYFNK